jgi:hypothetical protein
MARDWWGISFGSSLNAPARPTPFASFQNNVFVGKSSIKAIWNHPVSRGVLVIDRISINIGLPL